MSDDMPADMPDFSTGQGDFLFPGRQPMDHPHSEQTATPPATADKPAAEVAPQPTVPSVQPPLPAETLIREAWPTVLEAQPGLAVLAHKLIKSIVEGDSSDDDSGGGSGGSTGGGGSAPSKESNLPIQRERK